MMVFSGVYSGIFAHSTGRGLQSKTPANDTLKMKFACSWQAQLSQDFPRYIISNCASKEQPSHARKKTMPRIA